MMYDTNESLSDVEALARLSDQEGAHRGGFLGLPAKPAEEKPRPQPSETESSSSDTDDTSQDDRSNKDPRPSDSRPSDSRPSDSRPDPGPSDSRPSDSPSSGPKQKEPQNAEPVEAGHADSPKPPSPSFQPPVFQRSKTPSISSTASSRSSGRQRHRPGSSRPYYSRRPAYPPAQSDSDSEPQRKKKKRVKRTEEERKECEKLMEKIRLYESQGFVVDQSLNEDSSLADLKRENAKLYSQRKRKMTLMAMSKTLITLVAGVETAAGWLSKKTKFQLRLEGLSESVSEDIADYEPALSEFYEEHSEKLQISPWMGVLILLFHAAKTQHKRNLDKDRQFQMERLTWERNFAMEQLRQNAASAPPAPAAPAPAPAPAPALSLQPSTQLRDRLFPQRAAMQAAEQAPAPTQVPTQAPAPFHSNRSLSDLETSPGGVASVVLSPSTKSNQAMSPTYVLSPSIRRDKHGNVSNGISLKDVEL